jgi:RNA polymerase sigma-70 factor (ECF subfamily)
MQVLIDEQELIANCLAQQRKAQETLYNIYSRKMYGVAMRYAHCPEKAADILQESFVKIFKNLEKYSHTGSFEGWIRRIVVNTALDHYRQQTALHVVTHEYDENTAASNSYDITSQIAADNLIKLIQTLPNGYRTVLNLYAIEGYSHQEIAEQLNITEGTSKSQLSRAKNVLQQLINQQNNDHNNYENIALA